MITKRVTPSQPTWDFAHGAHRLNTFAQPTLRFFEIPRLTQPGASPIRADITFEIVTSFSSRFTKSIYLSDEFVTKCSPKNFSIRDHVSAAASGFGLAPLMRNRVPNTGPPA